MRRQRRESQPLIILFILFAAFLNVFMGSASAKWAILAPVFTPMSMLPYAVALFMGRTILIIARVLKVCRWGPGRIVLPLTMVRTEIYKTDFMKSRYFCTFIVLRKIYLPLK